MCTAESKGGSRLILDAITLCMTAKRGDEREGGRRSWGGFKGWALPFIASWPRPTQRCAVSRRGAPKHRSSRRKKRFKTAVLYLNHIIFLLTFKAALLNWQISGFSSTQ